MYQFAKGAALLLLLALFVTACNIFNKNKTKTTSMNWDYATEWKAVDSLLYTLPKSALERVEAIYARAKSERNIEHWAKASLTKASLMEQLEEDGFFKAMRYLETETNTAEQPLKAILQSILAQRYTTYLAQQGWNLSQRTPVPDGEGDIQTWSAEQVERRAFDLYLASTEPAEELQKFKVGDLKDLLQPGQNDTVDGQPLRPTMLDVLAHRAIQHFNNERSYLTQPASTFVLDNPDAFENTKMFGFAKFVSPDPYAPKWRAIQCYQRLNNLYFNVKGNPQQLDLALHRLDFALANSTLPNRKALYNYALEQLLNDYGQSEASTEILLRQATQLIEDQEGKTPPEKATNNRAAADLCKKAINKFPEAFGAKQCRTILAGLERKEFKILTEAHNLPDRPSLIQVRYSNASNAHLRIVRIKDMAKFDNDRYRREFLNELIGLEVVAKLKIDLKNQGDYLEHTTEAMLPALPLGHYAVIISENENLNSENDIFDYAIIHCTNMAAISKREGTNTHVWLVHRNTGKPLPNVAAEMLETAWENGRNQVRTEATATTDNSGHILVRGLLNKNISVRFQQGVDVFTTAAFYNYEDYETPLATKVTFFSDRSIYRPGQTIFFKGIALSTEQEMPSIVPNATFEVALIDANSQEKSRLTLKTNEYGTFNGVFTLPMGGLTGGFSLQVAEGGEGNHYFAVEEYKRPRFEVNFEPMTGSYRIGEQVTAMGKAMNLAGTPTDGATVNWRVVRRTWVPYWWYRCGGYDFGQPDQEIGSGTTTTDAEGNFKVVFKAIPSDQPADKYPPAFTYEVVADVTDISGETRSNSMNVQVGKNAFTLGNSLEATTLPDSLQRVTVFTNNLADKKVAAKGTITLQRLDAPTKVFKQRLWGAPDITTIEESVFRANFPEFAYNNEDDPKNWKPVGAARTFDFDTGKSDKIDLSAGTEPGQYKITMTAKDEFGSTITNEKIVRVRRNATDFGLPEQLLGKTTVQPGEKAELQIGTTLQGFPVLIIEEHKNVPLLTNWNTVNGILPVRVDVQERDRGNFSLSWVGIYQNRFYTGTQLYEVPFDNKKLVITYETFRDKLLPGSKEEWRIKISGPGKEKVAAELVASMYDASLDQIVEHSWGFGPYPANYFDGPGTTGVSEVSGNHYLYRAETYLYPPTRTYPNLEQYAYAAAVLMGGRDRMSRMEKASDAAAAAPGMPEPTSAVIQAGAAEMRFDISNESASMFTGAPPPPPPPPGPITPRKNLQETVFFYPELRTDANGDVLLKFTMNEALTRWKLQLFAHTKDLKFGLSEKTVVTQKDLMITANPPRFLRAGDQLDFAAKIGNLTDAPVSGKATLTLLDAVTLQPIGQQLGLTQPDMTFEAAAKQSAAVRWRLAIPSDYTGAVTWQVFAESKNARDGEESTLPVVTNRQLVTESLPLAVRGNSEKTFKFEPLPPSSSRAYHNYTLEFTSNPAWYAVQALPYLMEYPHQCSEQVFSRFYANTLAKSVTDRMPAIRRVYDRWKGTKALESNLSKNQELKSALLEETPWVLEAQQEAQQKQNIALLFDMNRMANEQQAALATLAERQQPNGGFPWFPGARESWYITQHIVCGLAHLTRLNAFEPLDDPNGMQIIERGLNYCNAEAEKQYKTIEQLVQDKKTKWDDDHLDNLVVQYLYTRSFFPVQQEGAYFGYFKKQIAQHWPKKSLQEQGMLALAAARFGDRATAELIVKSLRERATTKEELGMYWPNQWGMYWYQLPVETQAIMIEVFNEVANDRTAVDNLRIWLLKNKQTNRWESTKATAEAVYALLLTGDNWLENDQAATVQLGGQRITPQEVETGSGYFKQAWYGNAVKPDWETVQVKNPNSSIVWGAAYRQYFEDLDKITKAQNTGLTVVRGIFKQTNSATGPVLTPLRDGDRIQVGDKLKVRVEIRSDRAMEFVHLKDMRPAGCEPINVLSGYRYQGGLGYYESTRDMATHFFIDYLPRGTYVLEYPLVATHKGDMSFGIATLQCMYAPEFSSHSGGVRIKIE